MKTKSYISSILALTFACAAAQAGTASIPAAKGPSTLPPVENWLDKTITPVTNPIFFEDAVIRTEIRPIYLHHTIDNGFVTQGGDVNVYALQIRYAITDRLAVIATKDGYIDLNPGAGGDSQGWADVALGLKYAVIDDRENQFILTPGFTFEIPLGNKDVFQGNGSGEWNVFVSAEKGLGDLHLLGNVGFRIPNDTSEESTLFHYSVQADYYLHRYFIPFVSLNGFTVVDEGGSLPIDTEGFDLINFGSSKADGVNQMAFGVGFRSRVLDNVDVGFAWETALGSPKGLFDERITVDVSIRF